MKTPSTLAITRTAGLAVWAVTALPVALTCVLPGPGASPAWYARAGGLAALTAFAPAFWWNARRIQGRSPSRASVALLALQGALALLTVSDLVILVALQLPFVLTGRAAAFAVTALVAASAARALGPGGGAFLGPLPWLAHWPAAFVMGLTVITNALWQGLAFAGGYLVASQHRSAEELARVNAELRATQQLLAESSRLAERLHISRELHDTAGHHLVALSLSLELAARRSDGAAAEPLRDAQDVARLLLADVREMVSGLRRHRPLDLRRALATLAAGTASPEVQLVLPEGLDVADPSHAHALFRCVQEAITNAVRHARAAHLRVELVRRRDRLELRVRDDGRGTPRVTPGHGLTGLRERFEEAGGGLEVNSAPGLGFEIEAWLPAPEVRA